jgi:hypothetical protein
MNGYKVLLQYKVADVFGEKRKMVLLNGGKKKLGISLRPKRKGPERAGGAGSG